MPFSFHDRVDIKEASKKSLQTLSNDQVWKLFDCGGERNVHHARNSSNIYPTISKTFLSSGVHTKAHPSVHHDLHNQIKKI